jgi:hypothetical protein
MALAEISHLHKKKPPLTHYFLQDYDKLLTELTSTFIAKKSYLFGRCAPWEQNPGQARYLSL